MHKLSIKSLIRCDPTIKLSFLFSIQNPMRQQLAPIIVNINLSFIFFLYYSIQKFNVCSASHPIALSLWCHAFYLPRFIYIFVLPFFFRSMSTARRIFQCRYWFSMSNKLNKKRMNRIMILHMSRLMDQVRFGAGFEMHNEKIWRI